MGVHGLWPLLHPVARPVALETMGGKRLAIDSSIWLYQFQIAMRDKEGRALDNAHILGFLRRICKLLFYGIKPVFVFDGGAPLIKKMAISNRKNRKQGAKESAAKTAEKLLAAQLRAAAVAQAQKTALAAETGDIVDEDNANYLDEDFGVAPRGAPERTRKRQASQADGAEAPANGEGRVSPSPAKKKKYVHRDQYALPIIDGSLSSKAQASDPRLATEEELRTFIEDMRPEDFDTESDFFSNLPTEVKYEIIGDLRIKSRQANYRRVQEMKNAPTPLDFSKAQIFNLSNRNTLTQKLLRVTDSLSQSKLEIPVRIAGERNKEYVLMKNDKTTGTGWILGIRDQDGSGTTASKPVKIDTTTTDESDNDNKSTTDEEFEPVHIPQVTPKQESPAVQVGRYMHREDSPDLDIRRERAMEAIKARYSPVKRPSKPDDQVNDSLPSRPSQKPLFVSAEDDARSDSDVEFEQVSQQPSTAAAQEGDINSAAGFHPDFDLGVFAQIQAALAKADDVNKDEEEDVQRAIEASQAEGAKLAEPAKRAAGQTNGKEDEEAELQQAIELSKQLLEEQQYSDFEGGSESDVDFEEVKAASPMQHAKTTSSTVPPPNIAAASLSQAHPENITPHLEQNGHPGTNGTGSPLTKQGQPAESRQQTITLSSDDEASTPDSSKSLHARKPPSLHIDVESVNEKAATGSDEVQHRGGRTPRPDLTEEQLKRDTSPQRVDEEDGVTIRDYAQHPPEEEPRSASRERSAPQHLQPVTAQPSLLERTLSRGSSRGVSPEEEFEAVPIPTEMSKADDAALQSGRMSVLAEGRTDSPEAVDLDKGDLQQEARDRILEAVSSPVPFEQEQAGNDADGEDKRASSPEIFYEWSQSPEPVARKRQVPEAVKNDELLSDDPNYIPADLLAEPGHELSDVDDRPDDNDEDAEHVSNLRSEQAEYAKFLSELKNRNLDEMEMEVQNELRVLNDQNKKDRKMADDITQQMAKDIMTMLRVLGLPYVIAPMEAEAQCAELLTRQLVDGVITDDNDVFLFGATRVYKNMFNQNKYVECYLATDIDRELALNREKLIRLAYFLGSDYCDGLPGVGPVLGMELMAEFPGSDGLVQFRNWWLKCQRGKDKPEDNPTAFRRKFAKSKKDLFIDENWPNLHVQEAYLHPEVDKSDEQFAWGIPDLDALRTFLMDSLGWGQGKVDELMLPIIKRMTGRSSGNAVNQSTLSSFFDVTGGTGRYAPMANKGYQSKRLQNVVKAWRQTQERLAAKQEGADGAQSVGEEGEEDQPSTSSSKGKGKGKGRAAVSRRSSSSTSRSRPSNSRRSSRAQTGDGDESSAYEGLTDDDAQFNAELEAKLAKMGVKRKREMPVGSKRPVLPAKRSSRDRKGKGAGRGRGKTTTRNGRELDAVPPPADADNDDGTGANIAKPRVRRSKKKAVAVANDSDDYQDQ